jgi:hypothetical protein
MNKLIVCLLLLSFFLIDNISAQKSGGKVTITGVVTDASGTPVQNGIIMVDNEKTNSMTDADGKYRVKVKKEAKRIGVLTFTNGLKEEDIGGRQVINLSFRSGGNQQAEEPGKDNINKEAIIDAETYVDVGYSYTKKKNLMNQVHTIDATKKKKSYSTIYQMIQELPGVVVNGTSIVVDGSRNLWNFIPPLLVVDGVYVDDISDISPSSVESIVLLRGSSAAMYGSRGFGGVILIKRKKFNNSP